MKPKTCKSCKEKFTPTRPFQPVCERVSCAMEYLEEKRTKDRNKAKKAVKRSDRVRKQALKTITVLANEAQAAVNKHVRLRDRGKPCISCDKPDDGSHQRHASHLKSRGSNSALRFNLWNINASCSVCNNHLSGNIGNYIPRLIKKIGLDKYEWLLTQNQPTSYSREYLIRLKRVFNKRVRIMEKRMEMV